MFHKLIKKKKKSQRLKAAAHASYLDSCTPVTIQFKSLADLNSYQPFYLQLKLHTEFGRARFGKYKSLLCYGLSHMHDAKNYA